MNSNIIILIVFIIFVAIAFAFFYYLYFHKKENDNRMKSIENMNNIHPEQQALPSSPQEDLELSRRQTTPSIIAARDMYKSDISRKPSSDIFVQQFKDQGKLKAIIALKELKAAHEEEDKKATPKQLLEMIKQSAGREQHQGPSSFMPKVDGAKL